MKGVFQDYLSWNFEPGKFIEKFRVFVIIVYRTKLEMYVHVYTCSLLVYVYFW